MDVSHQEASGQPGALSQDLAVRVRSLRKSYGGVEAVRGIDLEVRSGEIFALLGPNGAGKTTTVEILEGYRSRNGGEVSVLGVDPAHGHSEWRGRIGIVLQSGVVEPELKVGESLELFAGYAPAPLPVDEVLRLIGLEKLKSRRAGKLSGGEKRRLDVGLGLIGDPELLFLDEPTTGFDPAARHNFWDVILGLRNIGKTILLTTHYMDEAQALADRVAILSAGKIVAEGPPSELGGSRFAASRVSFRLSPGVVLANLPELDGARETASGLIELSTAAPVHALKVLTTWAEDLGVDLPNLEVARPGLERIYLELTESEAK